MRLLVLGGTRVVGRAVVADALGRGWDVSTLNRGVTAPAPAGVTTLHADRTSDADLATALGSATWDLVVDTWAGAPVTAGVAARHLADRAGHYAYVSSGSVYTWGNHLDETSPLVPGDPIAQHGDYAALKRGAELAVLEAFPNALLARAGLILGPHEDIGRLPWWLARIARGGRVVAPGHPARPLQYVDARDLAAYILTALAAGRHGAVDVISRSGHATMADLLTACVAATGSTAELVWVSAETLATVGARPWIELPCWVPEVGEFAGFLEVDTARAAADGLRCRSVWATVRDTWQWLQRDGAPGQRADREIHGLPVELEQRILEAAG